MFLSQIFPEISNDDDDLNLRDTEGLTIREQMEREEAAEMAEGLPATTF